MNHNIGAVAGLTYDSDTDLKSLSDEELRQWAGSIQVINSDYVEMVCRECGYTHTSPNGYTPECIIVEKCIDHK